jgi:hypothetical protein
MAILKEEILNYNSLSLQPTSFISIYVVSSKGLNRHKKEKQITKQIVPTYFSGLCHSMKQKQRLMQEKEANQTSAKTFCFCLG